MHLHQNVSRNKFNITLIKPLKKVNREFKKKIYIYAYLVMKNTLTATLRMTMVTEAQNAFDNWLVDAESLEDPNTGKQSQSKKAISTRWTYNIKLFQKKKKYMYL